MWQFLVKRWIQDFATKQVYKAASEQAQQFTAEEASSSEEDQRLPVDVGIVMSHASEAGGLVDRLTESATLRADNFTVHLGTIHEKRIVIAVADEKIESAEQATRAIIDAHQPSWIIAAGFATGLSENLTAEDIILADRVIDSAGHQLQLNLHVDEASLRSTPGTHVGPVLSSMSQERAKALAGSALCADLHSFSVAESCRSLKRPCLVVRVVTRTDADQPPPELRHLQNQSSVAGKLGAATGAVWRRPAWLKDMWHDKELALRGSERLARFLSRMIAQLPANSRRDAAES